MIGHAGMGCKTMLILMCYKRTVTFNCLTRGVLQLQHSPQTPLQEKD